MAPGHRLHQLPGPRASYLQSGFTLESCKKRLALQIKRKSKTLYGESKQSRLGRRVPYAEPPTLMSTGPHFLWSSPPVTFCSCSTSIITSHNHPVNLADQKTEAKGHSMACPRPRGPRKEPRFLPFRHGSPTLSHSLSSLPLSGAPGFGGVAF